MRIKIQTLAADWEVAFDEAAQAIDAADDAYSPEERVRLRHALARERVETGALLERVARSAGSGQDVRSKITSTMSCS
jgi:hypothetical protein